VTFHLFAQKSLVNNFVCKIWLVVLTDGRNQLRQTFPAGTKR